MADDIDRRPLVYIGDKQLQTLGAKTRAEADALYAEMKALHLADNDLTPDDVTFVRGTISIWPECIAERLAAEAAGPGVAQERPVDLDGPPAYRARGLDFVTRSSDKQSDQRLHAAGPELQQDEVHVLELGGVLGRAAPLRPGEPQQVVDGGGLAPPPAGAQRPASYTARSISDLDAPRLGLRLDPDGRGVTFLDIQRVAHALHCTAELLPGFEVMLRGRMGERYCRSFGEAARCLNGKTFKPEALYG